MREIIEGKDFPNEVERIGGYRLIDEVLDPFIESLVRNPYGFPAVESDHFTLYRYVQTRSIEGRIPALVFAFTINDDKNVILEWIDEIDEAEFSD